MDEAVTQRSLWALAIDRRVVVLYNISACFAVVSLALIIWSQTLLRDGPFPADVKSRFDKLYTYKTSRTGGAFESLHSNLVFMIVIWVLWKIGLLLKFLWFLEKLIRKLNFTKLLAASYRLQQDLSIPGSPFGVMAIIPALYLLAQIAAVYSDTKACYTRYYYGHVLVYEPCEILGTSTTEYHTCKTASSKLFALQMASLSFALAPVAVFGLHFALTAYQIYTAFALLNRQLRIIKTKRPEIDAELDALEARERSLNGNLKRNDDLPEPLGGKGDVRIVDLKANMEKISERPQMQDPSAVTVKKD